MKRSLQSTTEEMGNQVAWFMKEKCMMHLQVFFGQ